MLSRKLVLGGFSRISNLREISEIEFFVIFSRISIFDGSIVWDGVFMCKFGGALVELS